MDLPSIQRCPQRGIPPTNLYLFLLQFSLNLMWIRCTQKALVSHNILWMMALEKFRYIDCMKPYLHCMSVNFASFDKSMLCTGLAYWGLWNGRSWWENVWPVLWGRLICDSVHLPVEQQAKLHHLLLAGTGIATQSMYTYLLIGSENQCVSMNLRVYTISYYRALMDMCTFLYLKGIVYRWTKCCCSSCCTSWWPVWWCSRASQSSAEQRAWPLPIGVQGAYGGPLWWSR